MVDTGGDTVDVNLSDPACKDSTSKCSLRAAIMQANYDMGADTIQIDGAVAVTTLSIAGHDDVALKGDLDITDDVTLLGNEGYRVDASGIDRAFHLLGGINVAFQNVRVQNGDATVYSGVGSSTLSAAAYGGGVLLDGLGSAGPTFDWQAGKVDGCIAAYGGGLAEDYGSNATLYGIEFYDNSASASGGGVYANDSTLVLETFLGSYNTAADFGGFGFLTEMTATITGGTSGTVALSNNEAYYGGGLAIHQSNATLSRIRFIKNTAGESGGGLFQQSIPFVSATSWTTSIDEAEFELNTARYGGGLYNEDSELFVARTILPDTTGCHFSTTADDVSTTPTYYGSGYGGGAYPGFIQWNGSFARMYAQNWGSGVNPSRTYGPDCYDWTGAVVSDSQDMHGRPDSTTGICDVGADE